MDRKKIRKLESIAYAPYEEIEHPTTEDWRKSYDALKEAVEKDTPVFVSEWGVGTSAQTGEPAVSEGREFAEWMNKKGISWCAWSLCNKDEVYSALKPDCYKWGGFTAEDFTEGGAMLFEELKG